MADSRISSSACAAGPCPVDDHILEIVSDMIGNDLKELGLAMGLTEGLMEYLENTEKECGPTKVAFQTLDGWRILQDVNATKEKLIHHLTSIKRRDIIQIIEIKDSQRRRNSSQGNCQITPPSDCPNSVFVQVSKLIGKDVKKLGLAMEIPDSKIEVIEIDDNKYGLEQIALSLMIEWRRYQAGRATEENLKQILLDIGRKDIIEKLFTDAKCSNARQSVDHSNSCVKIPASIEAQVSFLMEEIKEKLKNEYLQFEMKGLPWMEEIVLTLDEYYVDLSLNRTDKRGQVLPYEPIKVEEIFYEDERGKIPSGILVEGGPGLGKSTLAAKLAYDWAKGDTYMSHFDYVFFFPLRYIEGTIEESICRVALVQEQAEKCSGLLEVLNDKNKTFLFLMDGYDEILPEMKSMVVSLLRKQIYPHVTVVVTSRPGHFTANSCEPNKANILAKGDVGTPFSSCVQKRIMIKGFNDEQQKLFVGKHTRKCSTREKQVIEQKLSTMVEKEFLKCPLFLLMLLVVFTDTDSFAASSETKTELYKSLFNFVIRRYFSKADPQSVPPMNLFSFSANEKSPYADLMLKFSTVSLWALNSNHYTFRPEDIPRELKHEPSVLELGFLTRSITVDKFREKVVYEAVHKSLLEFAAAYGMCAKFVGCLDVNGETENTLTSIKIDEPVHTCPLLLEFLVGLMDQKAAAVFNGLVPYKAFVFDCFTFFFGNCLLEVKMTADILKSLLPFLPNAWHIALQSNERGFDTSEQYEQIVRCGIENGKIKSVRWHLEYNASIPNDVVIDTLILDAHIMRRPDQREALCPNFKQTTHKKCRLLWCNFNSDARSVHLRSFVDSLKDIEFQHLAFNMYASLLPCLHDVLATGILSKTDIQRFHIKLSKSDLQLATHIVDLVEKKNVELLEIDIAGFTQKDSADIILSFVSHASHLVTFILTLEGSTNRALLVDLGKLCEGNRKYWKCLKLQNVTITCNQDIKKHFSIMHLDLHDTTCTENTAAHIRHFHVMSLKCYAKFLTKFDPSWPFIHFLSELNVALDNSVMNKPLACLLTGMHNLKILALSLSADSSVNLPFEDWLMGSCNCISLRGLEVWNVSNNLSLAENLLVSILKCISGAQDKSIPASDISTKTAVKRLQLDYLLLQSPEQVMRYTNCDESEEIKGSYFFRVLNTLKESLVEKYLPLLQIVLQTYEVEFIPVCVTQPNDYWPEVFSYEEGFRIEYDILGLKDDDSISSKILHERQPDFWKRLSVTMK